MQMQGSPSVEQSITVMVAAGPQDEQASALVQAMRKAGLKILFAETVNIAARASEATVCVAVLRPDTWKTQAIATVMRAKPACLIPVLAEPMELPRGPWTHAAISLVDDAEQGTQQLIQAVYDYLAERPQTEPAPQKSAEILTINQLLARRKKRSRRVRIGPLITTILLLIIVALGGLLGYRYYKNQSSTGTAANASILPTALPQVTYTAKTPGPDCDRGGGQWEQGEHYKKMVNGKETEVLDKYTTIQCQSDGALVTRSGDYDVYSELFFDGPPLSASIAQHYFAQVDATITSGDSQAGLTMDTHVQSGGYTEDSYGRDSFNVNELGHWEANTASAEDGRPINRLAIGFLPKASKTYTLAVEVNGPLMTFWIDGTRVTTVTDTTYVGDTSIAFGVNDWSAKTSISALFSNFEYKELPSSSLATPQVIATATTQAQVNMQKSYSARVPGYACDKGAGQWEPPADLNSDKAVLHCLSNGMQLTEPGNAPTVGEEQFYWLDGHFPQNYKVAAQIDVSATNRQCAGLGTRANTDDDNYAFIICPDGSWEIAYISNSFQTLAQGWVSASGVYTVMAESNGSAQSLYINGQLIKTVNDSRLKSTDHISLDVGLYTGSQSASAIFSNFTFTPLA
jgi:hypothetical protein